MKKYVEFYFSELISDIYKGKAYRKSDIKNGETCDGKVLNYVTRTDLHNGIDTLIYNKTFSGIENGNAITIGDTTSTIFYQPSEFICGDHIVVVRAEWLNEYTGLYICSLLQKERFKYSYGRAFNIDYIKKIKLLLPVDLNDNVDWVYLENSMKKFEPTVSKEINKIMELSKGDRNIINTLGGKVNSFDFEKWTNQTKNYNVELKIETWKEFYVVRTDKHKGLLDFVNCKCGNATNLEDGEDVYYRGAKKNKNGVMRHVENKSELLTTGNCIFFVCDGDGSCGYTNYVEDDFIGSTTTAVGYDKNLNKLRGLFIVTILDKEKFKYSHGRKYRVSLDKLKIKLPIIMKEGKVISDYNSIYSDEGFVPDFEFMDNYIKSLPYSSRI